MDETKYRSSRLCRLLGNPVVFQIVLLLDEGGALRPSHLAKFAGRSVQTVSGHLAKLRDADVVRYSTESFRGFGNSRTMEVPQRRAMDTALSILDLSTVSNRRFP